MVQAPSIDREVNPFIQDPKFKIQSSKFKVQNLVTDSQPASHLCLSTIAKVFIETL